MVHKPLNLRSRDRNYVNQNNFKPRPNRCQSSPLHLLIGQCLPTLRIKRVYFNIDWHEKESICAQRLADLSKLRPILKGAV